MPKRTSCQTKKTKPEFKREVGHTLIFFSFSLFSYKIVCSRSKHSLLCKALSSCNDFIAFQLI